MCCRLGTRAISAPLAGTQDLALEVHPMHGRRSFLGNANPNSTALLEAYVPELRRFARALLHGDRERADDLVQDSLERALSHWQQRRCEGDLRGWVYTILYNRFLSDQHRQRPHAEHNALTEDLEDDLPGIDGGQEGALAHRDLLGGFAELPEEQRSVLLLIGVEDFSYAEAARILGVPIGSVMSRLSRGRERLRRYMDADRARTRSVPTTVT
jgi:RNA polymerase sigma-70 factor (ECF subfamily)